MNSSTPAWTDEQLAGFKAEWERQVRGGRVRLLTPLPLRVRLRLAVTHVIDSTAIKLAEHKHYNTARLVWRAAGGWR